MHADLILASASPRRRELLALLGVRFAVAAVHVDESVRRYEDPAALAARLAEEKAAAGRRNAGPGSAVLAADTVVDREGNIHGKPRSRADGLEMLRALSGNTHRVHTAVALHTPSGCHRVLTSTAVTFRKIMPAEAEAYWDTGEPADKAGGYAIQGLAAAFVRRIEGSHSGVVGLPLVETLELLQAAGLVAVSAARWPESTRA